MNDITLFEALQRGIAAHKVGKLQEADRFYTAILKLEPYHSDANYNMGVLAVGLNKIEAAIPFFRQAIQSDPSIPQFWISLVDALIKIERFNEGANLLVEAQKQKMSNETLLKMSSLLETRFSSEEEVLKAQLSQINNLKEKRDLGSAIGLANLFIQSNPNKSCLLSTLSHCLILQNKVESALEFLEKAREMDPNSLTIAWNFSRAYIRQHKYEKAKNLVEEKLKDFPDNVEGLVILGACLRLLKEYGESLVCLNKALDIDREYTPGLINRGLTHLQKGMKNRALDDFSKAHKLAPLSIDIWKITGDLSAEFGKFDEAEVLYKKLLVFTPNTGDLIAAVGVCKQQMSDLKGAELFYERALILDDSQAPVYNNIGILRQKKGDIDGAIDLFKGVIDRDPLYAVAHINLGNAFRDKHNIEEAIHSYKNALKINEDLSEGYNNMGALLMNYEFRESDRSFYPIMHRLLNDQTYTRSTDLAKAILSLLKAETSLASLLTESRKTIENNFLEVIDIIDSFPLLHTLMRNTIIPDKEFENLFSKLRYIILKKIDTAELSDSLENFIISLSLHNFINEYVSLETNEETQDLNSLELSIEADFMADKQPSTLKILCLATYRRISSYNWCTQLKFPRRLNELEKFTVRDPLEEKSLAEKIPLLCEILDDVSLKVRAQYENYPYPRWIKAAKVLRPQTIGEYIKEKKLSIFPEYNYDIDTPKILIAGCGTGQHSIEFAQRFKNSEVFSIDLSRASLAYAKRKSEELGLKNISFMQADIMDLGSLRDKYDVISCVGVLHHMEDPQVAWQILCNLLTDGGLMQIGLYSKLARENVARIKNDFKINSKSLTKLEIVRMRDDIANSKTEDHPDILRSKDFYSLSAVKDLLFHVHETAFTLTEIDAILNKLGLKFCGFDSQNLYSDFSMRFENETDLYSLERWNEFENLFPSIFRGMYQFWCQKY